MTVELDDVNVEVREQLDDEMQQKRARGDFIEETESEVVESEETEEAETEESEQENELDEDADDESKARDGSDNDDSGDASTGDGDDADSEVAGNGNVPRDRLNKEIQKRRELEARLVELESRISANTPPPENEVKSPIEGVTKDQFSEMQEAMIEGETDQAFDLFRKMLESAVSGAKNEARSEARVELETNRIQQELTTKANELSARFPELDYQSDLADETLIGEVVELRDINMSRGLTAAEALEKAVKYVAFENELKDRKSKPKSIASVPRTKQSVQDKIKLSEKEQGRLKGTSARHRAEVVDISKLSEDAFNNLSDEAKARARGDFLE